MEPIVTTAKDNDLLGLQREIKNSLALIDDALPSKSAKKAELTLLDSDDFKLALNTDSLLDRVNAICEQYASPQKPLIRVIHHLACSGGTLVSKCLSALPNVYLLSEVHPYTKLHLGVGKAKYAPSDLASLAKYANIPQADKISKEIFINSVKAINEQVERSAGSLILRDHTHSDYCVGDSVVGQPSVTSALENDFEVVSLITLRDPVDSYASLLKNNWLHFSPVSFDEYCARVLSFLNAYPEATVIKYEDFVSDPQTQMKLMCDALQLKYNDAFENVFDVFNVTGDSGRKSEYITPRGRRDLSIELTSEIKESSFFSVIQEKFGY